MRAGCGHPASLRWPNLETSNEHCLAWIGIPFDEVADQSTVGPVRSQNLTLRASLVRIPSFRPDLDYPRAIRQCALGLAGKHHRQIVRLWLIASQHHRLDHLLCVHRIALIIDFTDLLG